MLSACYLNHNHYNVLDNFILNFFHSNYQYYHFSCGYYLNFNHHNCNITISITITMVTISTSVARGLYEDTLYNKTLGEVLLTITIPSLTLKPCSRVLVDLNELPSIYQKVQYSHSKHRNTNIYLIIDIPNVDITLLCYLTYLIWKSYLLPDVKCYISHQFISMKLQHDIPNKVYQFLFLDQWRQLQPMWTI